MARAEMCGIFSEIDNNSGQSYNFSKNDRLTWQSFVSTARRRQGAGRRGSPPRSGKAGRMPPPTGGQPLDPVSRAVRSVRLTVPTDRLTETAAGLQEFPPGAIKFSVTTDKVYFTV